MNRLCNILLGERKDQISFNLSSMFDLMRNKGWKRTRARQKLHENGQLEWETTYKDGKEHGLERWWHDHRRGIRTQKEGNGIWGLTDYDYFLSLFEKI